MFFKKFMHKTLVLGLLAFIAMVAAPFAAAHATDAPASIGGLDGITALWAEGAPSVLGLGMQTPGSPVQERIDQFHDILLWTITAITLFVLALLIYVMVRFNKKANPTPSITTHNVKLEIIWTLLPCLILMGLAFWSFPLLYYSDRQPSHIDLTLKVTGRQWYWTYEYPDQNGITFDSRAIWDSPDVTEQQAQTLIAESSPNWIIQRKPLRMLEVDNRVVLPVGKNIRIQIAGSDVEHSWFLPSLGINRMAVPGRLSEVWLRVDREGLYYGQCSMICGNGHGYMPIVIEGVSPEKFATWVAGKKSALGIAAPTQQIAESH